MDIVVRASSTSGFPDCERRWAARHLPSLVKDAGYDLRELPSSIGAAIGSGTHSAVAFDLRHKMEHGELAPFDEVEDRGVTELKQRIEDEGVIWDNISTDLSDAQLQVRRLSRTYRQQVGQYIKPIAVERRLEARHSSGLIASGQSDVNVIEPNALDDTKTGKSRSANHAQYGIYTRLLRSHGFIVDVLRERYIPTVSLKREQPPVETIEYDIATCEQQAESVMRRIDRGVQEFNETGDCETWLANPSSYLCSPKSCPAHGTSFCSLGRE